MIFRQSDAEALLEYEHRPYDFVLDMWRWGEGELADSEGPREWQADILRDIGTKLAAGYAPGAVLMPILEAVASGHGIGKSALVSWIVWWAISTCPDTKAVVTANTMPQLQTKTWPEISKWARLARNAWMFEVLGMSIVSNDPSHRREWRADAVTWSENNLDAFAGLHNKGLRILLIFDEASGIASRVWEVAEGALTDEGTEIIWCAFGNPTDPAGRFAECFGRLRHRWACRQIDSRTVPGTNKPLLDQWVRDYGEDSDFVRVRVRGQFPRAGSMQLIGMEAVEAAMAREVAAIKTDPLIMFVDVARFGDDQSVIGWRKGRDARLIPWTKLRGVDTMTLAARIAELHQMHRPDALFIDGGGVGGGVIDRLRQLGINAIEVQFGGKADRYSVSEEQPAVANKRAEMWCSMRDWLAHGAIPDDPELRADLTGPQYSFIIRDGRDAILLEPKESMKRRGLSSPDSGDALAISFAYPVAPRPGAGMPYGAMMPASNPADYDPFAIMKDWR